MSGTIEELRRLMLNYRGASWNRGAFEDDSPERYEDACDMEDDARKALCDYVVPMLPALLDVVDAAQILFRNQMELGEVNWSELHRALAALGGMGEK